MDRAATPGLRLERIGVGERAVVEGAELGHPVGIAVGGGGAEADGVPRREVAVDRGQLGLEAGAALEQLAVVLDRVQPDLTARGADVVEQRVLDRVPLGDEVPRGDEAVALLDLENLAHVRDSGWALDVVGEDRREAPAFGPVRDRRHALAATLLQCGT